MNEIITLKIWVFSGCGNKLSILHFLEMETLVPYNGGKAFRFQFVKTNIFLNLMAMTPPSEKKQIHITDSSGVR